MRVKGTRQRKSPQALHYYNYNLQGPPPFPVLVHIYIEQKVTVLLLESLHISSVTLRRTKKEAKSSSVPVAMDAPNPSSSGASPFLANLPSRGLFSSTVVSSNPVLQFPFISYLFPISDFEHTYIHCAAFDLCTFGMFSLLFCMYSRN